MMSTVCLSDEARFRNLYKCENSDEFDVTHFERSKLRKTLLENDMLDPQYPTNPEFNRKITIEELTGLIMHTHKKKKKKKKKKNNSSTGYDRIPYERLKFPPVIATLQKLFQLIFDTSIIPSVWRKSFICSIHKDPTSDKSVLLNYMGISLLSCIRKCTVHL